MNKLITWCKEIALPWLRKNWWVVLLSPILFLPWLVLSVVRALTAVPVPANPLGEADERAKVEGAVRGDVAAREAASRAETVEALEAKVESSVSALEDRQEQETPAMREDLTALAERLKRK